MRKLSVLFSCLVLSSILGSCSLLPGGGDEQSSTGDTPGGAAPVAAVPPDGESEILVDTGLDSVFIPSTDPDARRVANTEGRPDPFADFSFQPTGVKFAPPPPPEPKEPTQTVPKVPGVNAGTNGNTNGTLPTLGNNGSNNGNSTALVSSSSVLDFSPVLPELPRADLAEETKVTGVVELNGVKNILVQAPGEASRYVQVGDYIANGQVKVKRVDFRRNSPVVVLEQYGVEVYKEIKDVLLADRSPKPAKADAEAEAAADTES
jgi:hypothetical protein